MTIAREEVLHLLTHLIDKSLVKIEAQDTEMRYGLLETVRAYSREKLIEAGEEGRVQDLHQNYFIALSERAWAEFDGPNQALWLERAELEHDKLRTALSHSLM